MRIRPTLAAALCLALLAPISGAQPAQDPAASQPAADALPAPANAYEQFWADQIGWMDRITQVLNGVTTPEQANAAVAQLEPLETQAQQFRERIRQLGPPTQDVSDACMQKYGLAIRAATQRLLVPTRRLAADASIRSILEPHMRKLVVSGATSRPAANS